jgi:hypothetical protein
VGLFFSGRPLRGAANQPTLRISHFSKNLRPWKKKGDKRLNYFHFSLQFYLSMNMESEGDCSPERFTELCDDFHLALMGKDTEEETLEEGTIFRIEEGAKRWCCEHGFAIKRQDVRTR